MLTFAAGSLALLSNPVYMAVEMDASQRGRILFGLYVVFIVYLNYGVNLRVIELYLFDFYRSHL